MLINFEIKPTLYYKTFIGLFFSALFIWSCGRTSDRSTVEDRNHLWRGWNEYQIPLSDSMARYGHQLISKTSYYLGPNGVVAQISNGMNCQNCHLNGGTVPWGNNYSAVYSTFPKFRARSGGLETIVKRVNDCIQRSLNGQAIDSNGKEMKAIIAYMRWLGDGIKKDSIPKGSGIMNIPYLDRPADPNNGKIVYSNKCQRCHGPDGQGQRKDHHQYEYPPLWGEKSYNTAAGLYRISRFAGFVKNNMPYGEVEYHNPQLTNEESWDVAAFVNSQPRPSKIFKEDWPDISKKPIDHPFGPFADGFSEEQHKYGPFKPIEQARKAKQGK